MKRGMQLCVSIVAVLVMAVTMVLHGGVVTTNSIASKGSVLPDGVDQAARIDSVGSGGSIALQGGAGEIAAVIQAVGDEAEIDLDGGSLAVGELAVEAGGAELSVVNGRVTPLAEEREIVAANVVAEPVSALMPVIWYDPSDEASVTLDGSGGVTRLANKAGTGSQYDAAVPANFIPPLLASGSESFGPLPMLRSDNDRQGVRSLANTGISGSAPRTLIAILARNSGANVGVSLGDSSRFRIFEVVSRAENTMFGTYNVDFFNSPAPGVGELKLLTFIAESGKPNPLFTFVDGMIGSTGEVELNTLNTPLVLGQRANQVLSWRGQVGEVILFDYALDRDQRIAVESYLMAKWKHGMAASGHPLVLHSESSAPLRLDVELDDPQDGSATLVKQGSGRAVLEGEINFTGSMLLSEGVLDVNVAGGSESRSISGALVGIGGMVKSGSGTLVLDGKSEAYRGSIDIEDGTLRISDRVGSGSSIDIGEGAVLDVASTTANKVRVASDIRVAGAGPDGMGAIINSSGVDQMNALLGAKITLLDETVFGSHTMRWDIRSSILDLNGHLLTKSGDFALCLPLATEVRNGREGTALRVEAGLFNMEADLRLLPEDDTRIVEVGGSGILGFFNLVNPMPWSVVVEDGGTIRNGTYNTHKIDEMTELEGSISILGEAYLSANDGASKRLSGQILGSGSLIVTNGGAQAFSCLMHPENIYEGDTVVYNAVLGLRYPGSLPEGDYSRLRVESNGGVMVLAGESAASGFTAAQFFDLLDSGRFTEGSTRAAVNTSEADMTLAYDIPETFGGRLYKYGSGILTLGGSADMQSSIWVWGGDLIVTNDVTINMNENTLYLRPVTSFPSLGNHFGGQARIVTTDAGYEKAQPRLVVGQAGNAKAVLEIDGDAFVQAALTMGGGETADTSAAGAIYHSGNAVVINTGGRHADGRIGSYGYGYYQIDSGTLTNKGFTSLGYANYATSSVGILRQRGGEVVVSGAIAPLPAAGEVGESYDGYLKVCASQGGGILQLEGGRFKHYGDLHIAANSGASNANDGHGIVTVSDTAEAEVTGNIVFGQRHLSRAILNLNGGRLEASSLVRSTGTNTYSAVNFNGGVLAVGSSGLLVQGSSSERELKLLAGEGGAVIEVAEGVTSGLVQPIESAQGGVVTGINLTNGGSGYIAPPQVVIAGGGGSGATAVAEVSRSSGVITAIHITSCGHDYATAPTVTFRGGGGSGASATTVVGSAAADGGLIKRGSGILALQSESSYSGPTVVEGGTLLLGLSNSVASASVIRIEGGMVQCAGGFPMPRIWYDPSDSDTLTFDQDGRVVRMANKGYTGSYHDAVPGANALAPYLAAGANSHSAHPMLDTSSEHANKEWLVSANNTGISGKAPRSLVAVISRNNGKGCCVSQYSSATGLSVFEILARATQNTRFGTFQQDIDFAPVQTHSVPYVCTFISGVGGVAESLATFRDGVAGPTKSLNINTRDSILGLNNRNNTSIGGYSGQIGEVMLFDVTLAPEQREALDAYLVSKWKNGMNPILSDFFGATEVLSGNTVELAGGELDLGGGSASGLTLMGSTGSISNGKLVESVISPGGDSSVGVVELEGIGFDGVEYRLSFDSDSGDLISSSGALDLSGLTVVALEEPSGSHYKIISAAGGLVGGVPQLSGLPDKWYLLVKGGDAYLTKVAGTLFMVK